MSIDSAKARKKIENISDLPTLPSVTSQIISMTNSLKTNAADVGHMIEQDQALTAKVLKLVNSSFYGFPGQIKSVQHAVVILGFSKVKNVVVTASVFDMTKGRDSKRLDIPKFWQHSLGVALGAKIVTPDLDAGMEPEDAFVGGLMHDLGKVILDQFLDSEYTAVNEYVEQNGGLIFDAERESIGFTHTQVGNWLGEKWKLPKPLLAAMRHHHDPTKAREEREMTSAVHLGDVLSRALGVGSGGDGSIPEINPAVWQQYNLSNVNLDKWLEEMLAELRKAKEFFALIEG